MVDIDGCTVFMMSVVGSLTTAKMIARPRSRVLSCHTEDKQVRLLELHEQRHVGELDVQWLHNCPDSDAKLFTHNINEASGNHAELRSEIIKLIVVTVCSKAVARRGLEGTCPAQ